MIAVVTHLAVIAMINKFAIIGNRQRDDDATS